MKYGLKPVIDESSKILILGSLPGELSLQNQKYYDNKNNHFWKLLSYVFEGRYIEFKNYEEKINFLLKHQIALWDVIRCANREGSLDSKIKNPIYNDLISLLNLYNIESIFVNGRKAEDSLKKYIKDNHLDINYSYLPSSSSLNAMMRLDDKAKEWQKIIKH